MIRRLPREYVASPVFTYGQESIVRTGSNSVSEYILTIPQNFTGDVSDFGSSAAGIGTTLGDGTTYNQFDGFAAFALRGLASDATLTLLNGRRMPSISMTEASTVSVIPSALIQRIDIIPDGASATYGADAVAGVVNIVTRKPDRGLEVRTRVAPVTRTGEVNWDASVLGGHDWGTGNFYIMGSYQQRQEFLEDPIDDGGYLLRISQLPKEQLGGFYAGVRQEAGDFALSLNGTYFTRDREARINYVDFPSYDKLFRSTASGGALYGNVHWQGKGATSLDLNLDWGSNTANSKLFEGAPPYGDAADRDFSSRNTLFVAELTGQTTLFDLPAGPLLFAGGGQYRRETLRTDATIFFNLNGGRRTAKSVFGELNVPLVGPDQDIPLVRSLTLTAAARYEDLGFDDALAPKLGLRWQIDRSVALRGTYSRSFLVPRFRDTIGIAEQVSFWNYPYAFLAPGQQNPALPAGNAIVLYRAGANPDLKTQNATSFTAGIDLTPTFVPGLTVKAGYYRIRIADRIVSPTQDDAVNLADYQRFNIQNPTAAQILAIVANPAVFRRFSVDIPFLNDGGFSQFDSASQVPARLLSSVQVVADIRPQNFAVEFTDGLDLDIGYRAPLFGGELRLNATGQYILNLNLRAGAGEPVSRSDGYAQPADFRVNGSALWGKGGFSIGSLVNYVDGFTDNREGFPERKIASYTTASLFFGFDLWRLTSASWAADTELQLVASNVFDARPRRITDSVLGFDPYNNPPNPRSIGIVLTKKLGDRLN